ncbi:hypothetical protein [Spongiimicrobium sp. 3-5]|uniref:hypothetical protein n=1 Tax=Spongiimicrobium sp. 3-5 TaxID=3332596 RepID=UPI003980A1DA
MKHLLYISLFLILILACSPERITKNPAKNDATLLTQTTHFDVGENVDLVFDIESVGPSYLIIKNAYGTSVLAPTKANGRQFKIPTNYAQKAGPCHWKLIVGGEILSSGQINFKFDERQPVNMESYLGPPSIIAGETDFSMFVNAPTDKYDNPLPNGAAITINHQFENNVLTETIGVQDMIAWKNIYSTQKAGRILINSTYKSYSSKEFTTTVFPSNPINFEIDYQRVHNYADGNQIINFTSSIIKDQFENTVSDGTLVYFAIENSEGAKLQTMGSTLNGIATAKMLHPSQKENWHVTAYVVGAAESNNLNIIFKPAILDYEIQFLKKQRRLQVGPLKSFMSQLIPDGITIKLSLYDQNQRLLTTKTTTSKKGIGTFSLAQESQITGTCLAVVHAMGLQKEQNIYLND